MVDIESRVRQQLANSGPPILPGARTAIAVGSRGIKNVDRITKAVVEHLVQARAEPFIVPAMGSHGGATAEGQVQILAGYGITSEEIGCPIRASMEVVEVERNSIFMDRHAWESDGVILINRIKPHTDFHGRYESGLVKMAVIGLGKEKQARLTHAHGIRGLREMVPKMAEKVFATGKILLGVAIIENAFDETAFVEVLPGNSILDREPDLLEFAKQNMPRLPVDDLDVLIVDQLGKDVSGTGMDTNIIGRIRIIGEPEPTRPHIRSVLVADLTAETHGNATGVGLADVVTQRLVDKIDFKTTYKNIITSGFLERGKLPIVAENDREGFEIALRGAGCRKVEEARIIRMRDTLHLHEIFASSAVVAELVHRNDIKVLGAAHDLFDSSGGFASCWDS